MINQLIQIYSSLVYHTALEVVLKSCKVNVLEIVRRSVSGCGVIVVFARQMESSWGLTSRRRGLVHHPVVAPLTRAADAVNL